MKKLTLIILALIMCMAIVACTGEGETTTEKPGTEQTPAADTTSAQSPVTGEETTAEAPAAKGYKVTVTDKDGNPIAGVAVQMCDDKGCRMPKPTGADGSISFDYDESNFHVLLPDAVAGYVVDNTKEYWFENGSKEMTIVLEKAN